MIKKQLNKVKISLWLTPTLGKNEG